MLEHELHDVVLPNNVSNCSPAQLRLAYPELVDHEVRHVLVQLIEERPCLVLRHILEAPLENSAPVWVRRKVVDAAAEGGHESQAVRCNVLDELLNDLLLTVRDEWAPV